MKRENRDNSKLKGEIRVVHVTALGITPRLFLPEHFSRLLREGFEVILVCSNDEHARHCAQATAVRLVPIAIKQYIAPISDFVSLLRLWRLLRRLRPVIVDSHMSKAGLIGSVAAWLAGVPIRIYHSHGMALLSASGWKYWLFRLAELITCKCASEVIFVAPSNMRDITNAGVCPKHKAVFLGPGTICGVNTEKFDSRKAAPRGAELRRKAKIPLKCWLVGFVGRIVRRKGVETVLEAWRLLTPETRENAYLCFIGEYQDRQMQALLEEAVSDQSLHVRYMGWSYDMPAWYSTMTLLVQASWHEGWSYSLLEAACSGVPAVGTRISGTIDAIVEGKTGILVPANDPKAMAEAITLLLTDASLRQRLGQAARERAISGFSQSVVSPLLTQEYRRLLRGLDNRRES